MINRRWYRSRWRIAAAITFICACSLGVTGCYDATEVENLNVVVGLGIDETAEGAVGVTAEIIQPQQQAGRASSMGERQSFTVYQTGSTIEDAIHNLTFESPRRLYFPHNTVVVYGQRYAEHGIDRAFDYFDRDRSYRRNQLFIVTEGTASELLQHTFVTQKVSVLGLRQLLEQACRVSELFLTEQLVVMRQYYQPSHTPLLAVINLSPVGMPYLAGIGVFNHAKLSAVLPFPKAYGLAWTVGNTQQVLLNFPLNGNHGPDANSSVRILRTHSDLHVIPLRGRYVADLRITGQFDVEHLTGQQKLSPEVVSKLEEHADQQVQQRVLGAVHTLQVADADGVQVANQLFRDDPKTWKQVATRWNDLFPTVEFRVHVHLHMIRSNLASSPPVSVDTPSGSLPTPG